MKKEFLITFCDNLQSVTKFNKEEVAKEDYIEARAEKEERRKQKEEDERLRAEEERLKAENPAAEEAQ
jgi:hypothetical protein